MSGSTIKTGGGGRKQGVGACCLPGWLLLEDWLGADLLVGGGERLSLHHLPSQGLSLSQPTGLLAFGLISPVPLVRGWE